jgi:AbrB family looped-hinge helix DNA binding protein
MRYNAKVTSKGQITIPVEVRRALDLEPGASVAFEVAKDYAVVTREASPESYFAEVRRRYPLPPPRYATEREGIEAHFRERWSKQELGDGWIVRSGESRQPLEKDVDE